MDGLLRRFAPLRKRFAFVAGNDDVSMRFIHAKTKCPAQGRAQRRIR
jgi:hypothetical protein